MPVRRLAADAGLLGDLPRFDAPPEVRSRILVPRRSSWSFRLSLAAAMLGVVVVGVGVASRTGLPFGGSSGAIVEPTSVAGASEPPPTQKGPAASAAAPTLAPTPPVETAWVAAPPQPAFDPGAAAPELPHPCGLYYDCGGGNPGDTLGPSPADGDAGCRRQWTWIVRRSRVPRAASNRVPRSRLASDDGLPGTRAPPAFAQRWHRPGY
jgi:hypothetical protein